MQCNDIGQEDLRNINEGLEGCQTDKGSIRDRQKRLIAERYNLLYRLCAFLGEQWIDFIRQTGLHKILIVFNPFLLYFIRILGMDTVDKIFVRIFFNQLLKVLFASEKYYSTSQSDIE
jgi:hypothetical protein